LFEPRLPVQLVGRDANAAAVAATLARASSLVTDARANHRCARILEADRLIEKATSRRGNQREIVFAPIGRQVQRVHQIRLVWFDEYVIGATVKRI
jgi:hypothetical protein